MSKHMDKFIADAVRAINDQGYDPYRLWITNDHAWYWVGVAHRRRINDAHPGEPGKVGPVIYSHAAREAITLAAIDKQETTHG